MLQRWVAYRLAIAACGDPSCSIHPQRNAKHDSGCCGCTPARCCCLAWPRKGPPQTLAEGISCSCPWQSRCAGLTAGLQLPSAPSLRASNLCALFSVHCERPKHLHSLIKAVILLRAPAGHLIWWLAVVFCAQTTEAAIGAHWAPSAVCTARASCAPKLASLRPGGLFSDPSERASSA